MGSRIGDIAGDAMWSLPRDGMMEHSILDAWRGERVREILGSEQMFMNGGGKNLWSYKITLHSLREEKRKTEEA